MNRHSILAVVALMAVLASSCGRLPAEAGGPVATDNENPFSEDGTPNSVDIAGVVVSSDETVVPPADGDDIAPPSKVETPSEADPAEADTAPQEETPQTETSTAPVTPPPVQKPDPVVPDGGQPSGETASGTHTVKLGETLSTIAEQYGISTKALQELNGLSDADRIKEGQELKVP